MLRAVLLGVLTLTAVSCKSHDAATSASQTVAAGKVIEVVGTVTLHHGSDATRPLVKGDMIDADDLVETGADGSAVIENQNNGVNWELGANKKGKLREALAWTAPKKEKGAKASEQDSTAAGRHAERSAAESSVTATAPPAATEEREDKAEEKKEEKAEAPKAAIAAPIAAQGAAQRGEAPGGAATADHAPAASAPAPTVQPPPKVAAATTRSAPPPPPPPPPAKSASLLPDNGDSFGAGGLGLSGTGQGGGGTGEGTIGLGQIGTLGKGGGTGTGQGYGNGGGHNGSSATSPNAVATKLVHTKDGDLKKCFKAGTTVHLRITIDVDGKATVSYIEKTVTDEQKTCVKNVVEKLEFAKTVAMVATAIKA